MPKSQHNLTLMTALLCAACVLSEPSPARAQEEQASPQEAAEEAFQAEAQRARELYAEERFDEAIQAFESAYALKPEPNILYNIGRIHEKKGEFEEATDYYERFVNEPDIKLAARQDALARIKALREVLAMRKQQREAEEAADAQGSSSTTDAAVTTTQGEEPLTTAPVDPPEPIKRPGIAPTATLVGLGVGSLVVGGLFARRTQVAHQQLEQTGDLEESRALRTQGRRDAVIADAGLITGVALIAAGVTLRIIQLRRASTEVSITSNLSSDSRQIGLHITF